VTPLTNTEEKYNQLLKQPDDVIIDASRAAVIWKLFNFKGKLMDSASLQRFEYRAFLQAAMMAAIDGSNIMGWVQTLFESSYKPDAAAKDIIKDLVKDRLKKYYKTRIKGEEPPIYNMVLGAITYQCSTYFDSISQGMDI